MLKREVFYFEKSGEINTDHVIKAVKERAGLGDLSYIAVASNSGKTVPRVVNGSIIYPQDKEDIIVIPLNQEDSIILDDFKNYYGFMSFSGVGTLEDYPWDSYLLHFYIDGLEEINITKNQEIYLGGSSRNKDWKISEVVGRLSVHKTDCNWFDVWITIQIQPLPIIFSVAIPLLILIGIMTITWRSSNTVCQCVSSFILHRSP